MRGNLGCRGRSERLRMRARMHPGMLILDHHLPLMAAISWRALAPRIAASPGPPARKLSSACVRRVRPGVVGVGRGFGSRPSLRLMACRAGKDGFAAPSPHDFVQENVGGIHVIVGPMFAGKTTALLKRIREEAEAGRSVSLVKSDKDNRYAVSAVVSHDGVQMPCVAVPSLAAFRERVGEEAYSQMDVIGIDEAQFFDDLLEFCQSAADLDNKTVIVAGLDGDFLRRRFGAALDLIPLADSVTKLHARCEICKQPAPFTFRKTVDTQTQVIGGADVYMPVCRHHFVTGQSAVETARTVLQESRREAEDIQIKPLQVK